MNAPARWFDTDTDRDWTRAADLCAECPIAAACLAGAKERRESHGLWGGHRRLYGRWVRVPTSSELAAAGAASGLNRQRVAWSLALNPALVRAHAAYARGLRDAVTVAGEREYQRERSRAKRSRLVADNTVESQRGTA